MYTRRTLKTLGLTLVLACCCAPAHAAPTISLGTPFRDSSPQANWYVPVLIDPDHEDSLLTMKGPDQNLAENLYMTGTLAAVPNPSDPNGGHYMVGGNFWPANLTYPYLQRFSNTRPGYYWTGCVGLWAPIDVEGHQCGPGSDNPNMMYAFRVVGEGTVRLIAQYTLLAKACDPYYYVTVNVDETPVYVSAGGDGEGGGGGAGCPPNHYCEGGFGIQQEVEVKRTMRPRATWGTIKQYYR